MAITFDVGKKPAVEFELGSVRVIEVGTGGSKPYEGDYEVTPKADSSAPNKPCSPCFSALGRVAI